MLMSKPWVRRSYVTSCVAQARFDRFTEQYWQLPVLPWQNTTPKSSAPNAATPPYELALPVTSCAPTILLSLVRALLSGFRTASRPFSSPPPSRMSHHSANLPSLPYQPSDFLKEKWSEEDLTSTADVEGGGFRPVRLGETFDDERFFLTKSSGGVDIRPCGWRETTGTF